MVGIPIGNPSICWTNSSQASIEDILPPVQHYPRLFQPTNLLDHSWPQTPGLLCKYHHRGIHRSWADQVHRTVSHLHQGQWPLQEWGRINVFLNFKFQRWQCPIHNGTFYKLCLIQYELDINFYFLENSLFSIVVSLQKWLAQSYCRNAIENNRIEHLKTWKGQYYPHFLSDKGFMGTNLNLTLLSIRTIVLWNLLKNCMKDKLSTSH